MPETADWPQLLKLIKSRRRDVQAYLRVARPRAERLTYVSIISSALAAVLTAGPAIGGARFTSGAVKIFGLDGAPDVWRPLCILAMVVSVIAAISANLSKSRNAEAHIIEAEVGQAELEGLQTSVEFRQGSVEQAVKSYQEYIKRIAFVPEVVPARQRAPRVRQNAK